MYKIGNGYIRRCSEGVTWDDDNGETHQLTEFDFATSDDAATVETSGFFDELADKFQTGTVIQARLDLNGTPALKHYIVTVSGGAVTVTAAAA